MVSIFPRKNREVFQIVFRHLLHVHMLVSIEWINYFRNGNDEYLNKYYKTNSSYQLRKLGMMFRVELKKVNLRVLICVVLISLCCAKIPQHVLVFDHERHIYLLICEWNSGFKTILSSLKALSHHMTSKVEFFFFLRNSWELKTSQNKQRW